MKNGIFHGTGFKFDLTGKTLLLCNYLEGKRHGRFIGIKGKGIRTEGNYEKGEIFGDVYEISPEGTKVITGFTADTLPY